MSDLISRKEAIEAFDPENPRDWYTPWIIETLEELPSAEPEYPTDVEEVLDYLDNVLHPILPPENWNVYSELHDMVAKMPAAQPGEWLENYVSAILQAGLEGREVSFKVGDRTFAVRELNDENHD